MYDDFCHANDPYEEHDFGSFEAKGHTIMFKIDYYGATLSMHSADPTDPNVTERQTNAKSTSGTTPTATETSKKLQGILFTTTRSGSIPGSDEGNSYERYGDAGGKRLLGPITTAAPAALASISIVARCSGINRNCPSKAAGPAQSGWALLI